MTPRELIADACTQVRKRFALAMQDWDAEVKASREHGFGPPDSADMPQLVNQYVEVDPVGVMELCKSVPEAARDIKVRDLWRGAKGAADVIEPGTKVLQRLLDLEHLLEKAPTPPGVSDEQLAP